MRAVRLVLLALCFTAPFAATASRGQAQDFGLGLVIGEPTGLSAQYKFGGSNALNFALGVEVIDDGPNDRFYVHIDYAFFITNLVSAGSFDLPFYVGVGGYFVDRNDATIGARMPFGAEMQFTGAPINIFAELGLSLSIAEDGDLDVFGALGARYYF